MAAFGRTSSCTTVKRAHEFLAPVVMNSSKGEARVMFWELQIVYFDTVTTTAQGHVLQVCFVQDYRLVCRKL